MVWLFIFNFHHFEVYDPKTKMTQNQRMLQRTLTLNHLKTTFKFHNCVNFV